MVDYIGLMTPDKVRNSDSRQNEISEISRSLKILAKELNVPVLALSQLNRAVETRKGRPQLSDLRESGAIEQDADIVMFISRPEAIATKEEIDSGKIVKGAAELILAKHRAGEQGRVSLKFIGECTKFVDVDEQNRDDEPPEFARAVPVIMDDDDEEYVAPDDDYTPPEPPMRKGELKPMDDELPFE
jgi:replicative DNA helicase